MFHLHNTVTLLDLDENCALLGYYATGSGHFLPTFRDTLTVTSSVSDPEDGTLSVRNYHYSLRNNAEERDSHLLRGGSLKSRKFRSSLIRRGYITRSFLIYEVVPINYETD